MKLYDVPRKTYIRVIGDAQAPPSHRDFVEDEILYFDHVDGMYSLCYDSHQNPVHLAAWAEVEIVEGEEP